MVSVGDWPVCDSSALLNAGLAVLHNTQHLYAASF